MHKDYGKAKSLLLPLETKRKAVAAHCAEDKLQFGVLVEKNSNFY